MRIMVFDVPAESGGALSVLQEYYNEYKNNQENEYIFVLSLPIIKETSNIKVLRFPWIKKSWIHRLYFDYIVAPKLIKNYKVDKVLSLQNTTIPHAKVYQELLVHNALPFSTYKFSFRESRFLWFYQNAIGKIINKSIKKANCVTVQTNWMKNTIVEQLNIKPEKIKVHHPKVDIQVKKTFEITTDSVSTFFYPASGAIFKNHKVIVDACLELNKVGIQDYKVIFTLLGDENKHILTLRDIVERNQLPIVFIGSLSRNEVFEYYTKSILLFPSYIETVGLPLIEAKKHETPIIVSDSKFAQEILFDYDRKMLFKEQDVNRLYQLMKLYIL